MEDFKVSFIGAVLFGLWMLWVTVGVFAALTHECPGDSTPPASTEGEE